MMIKKDFIMRMIEQLTTVLAKVLFNKEQNNLIEANTNLDSAFKEIIGLDYDFIKNMSTENLLSLININKKEILSSYKVIIIAKLLFEKAQIEEQQGNKEISFTIYKKALEFYLTGYIIIETDNEYRTYLKDIETILQKYSHREFPGEINYKLFEFYKKYKRYNEAENILFYLNEIDYHGIYEKGKSFYDHLEKLSDEDLQKSNFPREEIQIGLKDLQKKV